MWSLLLPDVTSEKRKSAPGVTTSAVGDYGKPLPGVTGSSVDLEEIARSWPDNSSADEGKVWSDGNTSSADDGKGLTRCH